MLALLVPGVGMGASENPPPVHVAQSPINRRVTNLEPYLTAFLAAFVAGVWFGR